jgi:enoyl-CoA hydratase
MKMVLLGEPLTAEEARHAGLVNEVVDPAEVLPRALNLAETLAGRAPLALRQAKASVAAALDLPHAPHLAYERQAFATLFATDDKREGVAAFLEKRKPEWKGK